MDDLISRQSVINIFLYFNANQRLEMIKKLPSAQQWIPVSERLPEDDHAVMIYEADNKNHFLAIYEDGRWKSFDPTHNETYFDETIYWHIVAWMPLPEPWRGEGG